METIENKKSIALDGFNKYGRWNSYELVGKTKAIV